MKKKASTSKKRIYNPVTKSYYKIRVRSTSKARKGTIISKWSSKRSKSAKK